MGRSRENWLNAAIAEYAKRLEGRLELHWMFAEDNGALLSACKKESQLIALDIQGELLSSEAFSAKWIRFGARTTFVIGGPEGLSSEIKKLARFRWSLSPLTFTNQMARLILIEQLYRAVEIERGSPYHK